MSWDFQTEPEFEAKLAWMREFMREEVWPLEVVVGEFEREPFIGSWSPFKPRYRRRSRRRLPDRTGASPEFAAYLVEATANF
jgi:hypothetical protein